MDRLFKLVLPPTIPLEHSHSVPAMLTLPVNYRKRAFAADTNFRPATLRKTPSSNALNGNEAGKMRGTIKDNGIKSTHEWGDGVPSLDVDIRNSLILPG